MPSSAHKAYGFLLAQGNLARSESGQTWVRQSERALLEADPVTTPFETSGHFTPGDPAALGYRFPGKSGKRIEVELELEDGEEVPAVFVDLYRFRDGVLEYVASAPPPPALPPVPGAPIVNWLFMIVRST